MTVLVHNRSRRSDDEVERLILLGVGDLHLPGTLVEVSDAPQNTDFLGYARSHSWRWRDRRGNDLIVLRVPGDREADGRSTARTWREWTVWLVAHEASHVVDRRKGLSLSEERSDAHAEEQLAFYREIGS